MTLFAFPHSLHTVRGVIELIGFIALDVRPDVAARAAGRGHRDALWILYIVIVVAIALNLSAVGGANKVSP